MTPGKRWALLALIAPMLVLAGLALSHPPSAEAHPLGNFTINRYSRIDLYSDLARVRYVLDMAEIPAFQETPQIDANGDGDLSSPESEAYLANKAKEIADNLRLQVNGSRHPLTIQSSTISYPEGQAGLRTLRIALVLDAPVSGASSQLEYHDDNYADRVGWKEVVVRPAEGVVLKTSSAPSADMSAELTSYPADLISSPLDITSASASFAPGDGAKAPSVEQADSSAAASPTGAPQRVGGAFAALIGKNASGPIILLSLLLALGFGALHALEPGHGKTFVAAYFVGVRGTVRQALGLGLIVALTHTVGVLTIGLVTLFGSQYILPEKLYPWLTLASALMVLALGARLIASRAGGTAAWRRFASILRRSDAKSQHLHEHHHAHPHGDAPPWKGLIALGLADGLTPSPSALVVLLAAISLHRIELGLLLIISFSAGLAVVLTLISLMLVYVRRLLDLLARKRGSFGALGQARAIGNGAAFGVLARFAPVGGAFGLLAVGVLLTVRALTQPGLPVF